MENIKVSSFLVQSYAKIFDTASGENHFHCSMEMKKIDEVIIFVFFLSH